MARKNVQQSKPRMEGKFYIYIGSFFMFGTLALFIAFMGLDLGFVRIGGAVNANLAPWVIVAALVMEFFVDIRYCHRLRMYMDEDASIFDYIPYVNTAVLFGGVTRLISLICTLVVLFCVLMVTTPLASVLPSSMVIDGVMVFLYIGIGAFVIFCCIRGWEHMTNKRVVTAQFNQLAESGAGGSLSLLRYMFYYLPIIRAMNILSDAQFMVTVKTMLLADAELEHQ